MVIERCKRNEFGFVAAKMRTATITTEIVSTILKITLLARCCYSTAACDTVQLCVCEGWQFYSSGERVGHGTPWHKSCRFDTHLRVRSSCCDLLKGDARLRCFTSHDCQNPRLSQIGRRIGRLCQLTPIL
jgi:hypothetical protein